MLSEADEIYLRLQAQKKLVENKKKDSGKVSIHCRVSKETGEYVLKEIARLSGKNVTKNEKLLKLRSPIDKDLALNKQKVSVVDIE
jgi:myosin-crossreactive antigen